MTAFNSNSTSTSSPATTLNASRPSFFRSLSSSSHNLKLSVQKDKPRLYLALYPRGGSNSSAYSSSLTCDSYHWAFMVAPQTASRSDPGSCHQLVHSSPSSTSAHSSSSYYEEKELSTQTASQAQALLVRITLAKIVDEDKVRSLLRSISTSCSSSPQSSNISSSSLDSDGHEDYSNTSTCLTWIKAAFKILASDPSKPLKSYIGPNDWPEIEACARKYVRGKRRQGRFHNLPQDHPDGGLQPWMWRQDDIPTWNFWENRETTA